jgi:hypothetical protein
MIQTEFIILCKCHRYSYEMYNSHRLLKHFQSRASFNVKSVVSSMGHPAKATTIEDDFMLNRQMLNKMHS